MIVRVRFRLHCKIARGTYSESSTVPLVSPFWRFCCIRLWTCGELCGAQLLRYRSVLRSVGETEKRQRLLVAEAWNIQGWVSVGMHKLVQQTLRALVRYCTNPHAVSVIPIAPVTAESDIAGVYD